MKINVFMADSNYPSLKKVNDYSTFIELVEDNESTLFKVKKSKNFHRCKMEIWKAVAGLEVVEVQRKVIMMTKDDWIARALYYIKNQKGRAYYQWRLDQSSRAKENYELLTELVRVAEEEFNITEKGE